MNNKIEEALKISEEILDNLEDSNFKNSVVVLKCLKLARLMDDYDAIDWLLCEIEGYKSDKNGIPSDLFEIGIKHGRETEENEKGKTMFTDLSSELELLSESSQKIVGTYTTEGVSVAGDTAAIAMNNLLASVRNNNTNALLRISSCQRKLSILRGEYYKYVMNINIQLKFSDKVDSIFDDYRLRTDNYLVDNLPSGTKKLSSIYSRLKENDEESYSQASTSCRKLIREFTDDLFKKIYPDNTLKKIELRNGKSFDITGDHYLNRLYVVLDSVSVSKMKEENIIQTANWIESINDRICNGLHNDISLDEIKDTILHMYILIGDMIKGYEQLNDKNQV